MLPTTRFVARTTRPRRNVRFETMCDGIGVATGGRLVCASPMPERYELSELSLGPLRMKGGLTQKVTDGTGTCRVFSKRYSLKPLSFFPFPTTPLPYQTLWVEIIERRGNNA